VDRSRCHCRSETKSTGVKEEHSRCSNGGQTPISGKGGKADYSKEKRGRKEQLRQHNVVLATRRHPMDCTHLGWPLLR